MILNGHEFTTYRMDTKESIHNRIAAYLGTLPQYVYIIEPRNSETVNALDLLKIIVDSSESMDIKMLENNLEGKTGSLSWEKDIIPVYVADNRVIKEAPKEFQSQLLLALSNEIKEAGYDSLDFDAENIWRNRNTFLKELGVQISEFKKQVDAQVALFKQYEDIQEYKIPYTDFDLQKLNFNFRIVIEEYSSSLSLLEIFNHVKLNRYVPFATINEFYKILRDFVPPEEWSISLENAIVLKVLEKTNYDNVKHSDYTDAFIEMVDFEGDTQASTDAKKIIVNMHLNTSGTNLETVEFANRLVNVFTDLGTVSIADITEIQVNGVFFFPNQTLNNYVFSDMAMNDPILSSILAIDESEKTSKSKPGLYVYFYIPGIGSVTVVITERVVQKGENLPGLRLPEGSKYTRVRVSKCKNLETVKKFQVEFSKLFELYNRKYNSIVQEYRKYLPNFADETKQKQKQPETMVRQKLKVIAPEIFPANYTRKCPKSQNPTIISDAEAQVTDKQVMTYPKPGTGQISRNYICENPKYPYPGLRDNPFENSDIIPYLPCCYVKSQAETIGSKYRHYYMEEAMPPKDFTQQDMYTTNKFVPNTIFGILPTDISRLFNIIDTDADYTYVRRGVPWTKNTFLDCILEAFNINNIRSYSVENRDKAVSDIRLQFSSPEYAAACKQEMYDSTVGEIISYINDPEVYLSPRLFVSMVEHRLKCNVFLFTRDEASGSLQLPRHTQAYYRESNNYPSVFIFEHMGSEADHASYPHCELITRLKSSSMSESSYVFPYESDISTGVRNVYEKIREAYALSDKIPQSIFPLVNRSNFVGGEIVLIGQRFDSYGKCRMIFLTYRDVECTIVLSSPIQPLVLREINPEREVKKVRVDIALKLADVLHMNVKSQTVMGKDGVIREINGEIGNIAVSIPVENSPLLQGVVEKYKNNLDYSINNVSAIFEYNQGKKLARYITEYMLWMYSHFLHDNGLETPTLESMDNFLNKTIDYEPNFKYGYVSNIFSMQDGGVIFNGKLVVNSKKMLTRLVYMLKLSSIRHMKKIVGYRLKNSIENYCVDITDFNRYNEQVILHGEESVSKWIREFRRNNIVLSKKIITDTTEPYFFKNRLVENGKVFIAQNTTSVENAMSIAVAWVKKKYNPGADSPPAGQVDFILYSYVDSDNITRHPIGSKRIDVSKAHYSIMGYKDGTQSYFTVLLNPSKNEV